MSFKCFHPRFSLVPPSVTLSGGAARRARGTDSPVPPCLKGRSKAVAAARDPDGFMQRVKAIVTAMPYDQLCRTDHKWSDPRWAHAMKAALPSHKSHSGSNATQAIRTRVAQERTQRDTGKAPTYAWLFVFTILSEVVSRLSSCTQTV
jgi:hypothetical protein